MNQEELKKLKEMPGEARGVTLQTDANYVLKTKGEEGLAKVQRKLKELGLDFDYKQIKTMDWYPIGWRVISLLAICEVLGWGDKEIKDMGNCAPKYSFIATTMLKYFLSVKKVFQESSRYWSKHYTVGRVEATQIDEEKKYGTITLKDFKVHPILCPYYEGYFLRIGQFVIKSKEVTCQETECIFKGGSCDRFLIKWT